MAKKRKELTVEDRKAIMNKYNSGDEFKKQEAIAEMLDALEDYIYHLIHMRFAGYLGMIEDLAQSGRLAIVSHMADYNPEFKLTTFFSFHIQNEMQELVNKENGESHYYAESKNIIVKTIREMGMDMDNIDEPLLAMKLNMTTTRLHSILENTIRKKKIELIEEDQENNSKQTDSPESSFLKEETKKEFRDCLNELDEIENIVLCMHFGFYYPKYNEQERLYRLPEIQKILDKEGFDVNAVNEYRAARRHIAEIMYDRGIVRRRNRYQDAKDEIGLKFINTEEADEMFDALNDLDEVC